jgi:HD superfamily phosphodiesterase
MTNMKTEMQIERDFFSMIKSSSLAQAIKGSLYRSEMRPTDATTEDIIVKFLAGVDEQIQSGTIVINVYVPDTTSADGRKVEDKQRVDELQQLLIKFVEECDSTEYWIQQDGTPHSTVNEDIEQHLIVSRIKFQRLTV